MSSSGLLWVFASVVILAAQMVIVWKAHAIFRAVADIDSEQQNRVLQRVEELFAAQKQPPFEVTVLMDKMQETYLEHLDAVRAKHEERYEKLIEQKEALYKAELEAKEAQLRILSEENSRLQKRQEGLEKPGSA